MNEGKRKRVRERDENGKALGRWRGREEKRVSGGERERKERKGSVRCRGYRRIGP